MKEKLSKLKNVYKKYGFKEFIKKCYQYFKANYLQKISFKVFFNKKKYRNLIKDILESSNYERVIVWRSSFGYNVPLFQRPQHIANNLALKKCLVFYEVTTMNDHVKTIKKEKDNLYLMNFNNKLLNKLLNEELDKIDKPKFLEFYSTNWDLSFNDMMSYVTRGFKVIYEYIDEISADISGTKEVPKSIIEKYDYAMSHDDVYIVTSAEFLKEDTISKRGSKNMVLSSNGVDYKFWQEIDTEYEFDDDFKAVIDRRKPIVCYYGALAKWFDYDLIKKISNTGLYSVVLFGVKYDENFDAHFTGTEENIFFLGPRDYKVLKNYANKCDILIIPFLVNDVTKSTSPVKIFEYMALHKPIVTTAMRECQKYESVMIGRTHEEFIELLDKAMSLKNDKKYLKLLDKEARENDWAYKAQDIIDLISENK